MNPLRVVVSVCLLAGILAAILASLASPVLSTAPHPATFTFPTITGPTTIMLPTQTLMAITTNGYVVWVVIMQDDEGHTVTQTLWTMSTLGKTEPAVGLSSWPMVYLIIGIIVGILACLMAVELVTRSRKALVHVSQARSTVFCIQCGAENPSTYGYCGKCGSKLKMK